MHTYHTLARALSSDEIYSATGPSPSLQTVALHANHNPTTVHT
jgi:hypothetical protein